MVAVCWSWLMKLIAGLGNPGRKYQGTRHNVGYEVIAELARRFGAPAARSKFQGEVAEITIEAERVLLLCPHTYMNRSGDSVGAARDFYKLESGDLLVVCDDFNLPLAKLRFRARGSSGGQKGLANVIQRLGNEEFARLRIGIGPPPDNWDIADYVLSRYTSQERDEIDAAVARAADAVVAWTREGVEHCMNQYNAG